MNYVDANVIIYAFIDESEKGTKSRELLKTQRLATSVLSLDEVAYEISKKSKQQAVAAVDTLAKSPGILLVPFLPEDVDSFKFMLEKGLKPRDAIHALTAVKMNVSIMYSEDRDFDVLKIPRKTPWT